MKFLVKNVLMLNSSMVTYDLAFQISKPEMIRVAAGTVSFQAEGVFTIFSAVYAR
jgi:hypothetical protein